MCRVADATNEAELVRLAQEMNADQLERMCRLLRGLDDRTDAQVADLTSMTTRWGEDLWVTSIPDLITITPDAGGSREHR